MEIVKNIEGAGSGIPGPAPSVHRCAGTGQGVPGARELVIDW